jgi:hypothetical protein
MFHALQMYVAYVLSGCCKIDLVLHMLQWLYTCVASVCFKCLCFFKRMLQVFHLYVAYVATVVHICCKCVFQMLQVFHLNVACFHLDVAYIAVDRHIC